MGEQRRRRSDVDESLALIAGRHVAGDGGFESVDGANDEVADLGHVAVGRDEVVDRRGLVGERRAFEADDVVVTEPGALGPVPQRRRNGGVGGFVELEQRPQLVVEDA